MNVFEVNLLSLRLSSSDDPRELGLDKLSAAKWISFRDWKKGVLRINQIVIFIDLVNLFNAINCSFWIGKDKKITLPLSYTAKQPAKRDTVSYHLSI